MTHRLFDDPALLLAETRALRRLARQLVADPQTADDLVQGTWLTALRRPSANKQQGGWLRGVMHNLLRQERRSDTRRRNREQATARPESQPDAVESLERLEVLQAVVAAVSGLPEPYRGTVMSRFFEDQTPREIAERQGLPLATVRTRLQRALGMLRETLDRRNGAESQDWRGTLLLLSAAETLAPALVMSSKLKFASLILVSIGLIWSGAHFLLPPGEQIEAQPEQSVFGPAVALRKEAVVALPNSPIEVSAPKRVPAVLPAEDDLEIPPGMIAVTGWVRDDGGRGIGAARVWSPREETLTYSDGRYRILLDKNFSVGFLYAEAEGHVTTRAVFDKESGGGRVSVDFALRKEFRISGRIIDAEQRPVEGAKVTTFYNRGEAVISDADGSYVLSGLDPGRPKHLLRADKQGFVRAKAQVHTVGAEVEQDLILDRGNLVRGLVVTRDGEPIVGASIYVGFSPNASDRIDANSNEEGYFVFPAVRPGNRTMVVQHADHAAVTQLIQVPSRPETLDMIKIELSEGRSIEGRVLDQNNMPISGASLHAQHRGRWIHRHATSDKQGHFRLDHLPESELSFSVHRRGYVYLSAHQVGDGETRTEVMMQGAGKIVGRVLDARDRRPLKNFTVRFVSPDLEEGEARLYGYSATWGREGNAFSDPDGYWSTIGEQLLPGGVIGIEISAKGFATKRIGHALVSVEEKPEPLVIELIPGTRLFGVVVAGDVPISGARITLLRGKAELREDYSDQTHDRILTHSGTDGSFEFQSRADGTLHLAIDHEKHAFMLYGPIHLAPGQLESEERIVLEPGWDLSGKLYDASGQPRPGVEVALLTSEVTGLSNRIWRTETGPRGEFHFAHLSSGAYLLRDAYHRGNREGWTVTRLVQVESFDQSSTILRPGSDRGEVWGELRADLSLREPVQVSLSGPVTLQQVIEDGSFRFRHLPPGKYKIYVHHRASNLIYQGTSEFELDADASKEVDVLLKKL